MRYLDKKQIRQEILMIRNNLSNEYKQEAQLIIMEKIKHYIYSKLELKANAIIAGYYPFGSELNILTLLEELAKEYFIIALPAMQTNKILKFYSWNINSKLKSSKISKSILEPSTQEKELTPDLIITPLIACDLKGNRIGYGKAIYDHSIAELRATKSDLLCVGLCYDTQLLDQIPNEDHDQKIDLIITEKRSIRL